MRLASILLHTQKTGTAPPNNPGEQEVTYVISTKVRPCRRNSVGTLYVCLHAARRVDRLCHRLFDHDEERLSWLHTLCGRKLHRISIWLL